MCREHLLAAAADAYDGPVDHPHPLVPQHADPVTLSRARHEPGGARRQLLGHRLRPLTGAGQPGLLVVGQEAGEPRRGNARSHGQPSPKVMPRARSSTDPAHRPASTRSGKFVDATIASPCSASGQA